jgi:beta-glucosidase
MMCNRQARLRVRDVLAIVGVIASVPVSPAAADAPPYRLPVGLPRQVTSPPMAAGAPFTPLVKKLLHQLEPAQPNPVTDAHPAAGTTAVQLLNADRLLEEASSNGCTTVGYVDAPTGTDPAIPPQCWADAQGVLVLSGQQIRETTATMNRTGIASSWDPAAMNAWGQVEGTEGRWLGITGLYAPQVDLVRIPNWGRNVTVFGEDPFLVGSLAAGEVNGMQGKGLMSQVKHFAFYDGQLMDVPSAAQDQAGHELFLSPYEHATSGSGVLPRPGQASSMMCSYATYKLVAAPGVSGGVPSALSPAAGDFSCNNQIKNLVAHDRWRWAGFFASDYALEMAQPVRSIESGLDQEFTGPGANLSMGPPLVAEVQAGVVPLSTFNTAVARILYQDERFHLLGHADANSNYLSPSNPINKSGQYGLTPATKARNGATVERVAEEGGVLLKNANRTLPVTKKDLRRGVLVVGEGAEYMPADPGTETSAGFPDRDAISPLEQLKQFAPRGSKISFLPYMPGSTPSPEDGKAVPRSALSTNGTIIGNGLMRTTGPGSPKVDRQIDFTNVARYGQLAFGTTYTWTGYVNVPAQDDYTFRFQFSVPSYTVTPGTTNGPGQITPPACTGSAAPSFGLATSAGTGQSMSTETLSQSPAVLGSSNPPSTDPTASGYTERGLANCDYNAGTLPPGIHEIKISWTTPTSFAHDTYHMREPGSRLPSFRFAYSRTGGDRTEAIAAAKKAAKVIVFADCTCVNELSVVTPNVNQLDTGPAQLINEMAAANPNTVVVTNFDVATLMPWLDQVRSVLQMWLPGSEGGTATARLLLGLADPSGHLTTTWPKSENDTIFAANETNPLYPGDTTGVHSDRMNGNPFINWTEGIYVGYRFFDREGIAPLFPFGWGLSYTEFRYSGLRVHRAGAGLNINFNVSNTGQVAGTAVPQVYIGPAPTAPAGVQQAVRSLAGFARVKVRPHLTVRATIHLGPGHDINGYGNRRAFQYWDTTRQAWATAAGARTIWVGDADTSSRLVLSAVAAPR